MVVLIFISRSGKYVEKEILQQDTHWRTRAQVSAVVSRLLTFSGLRSVGVVVRDWPFTAEEMRWVVLEPFVRLAKVTKVVIEKIEKVGPLKIAVTPTECLQQLASEFPPDGKVRALRRAHR